MIGQNSKVLDHLKKHRGLTQMEAMKLYGVTRLAARISDLREMGYKIITLTTEGVTRYGRKTRYATYVLMRDGDEDGNNKG